MNLEISFLVGHERETPTIRMNTWLRRSWNPLGVFDVMNTCIQVFTTSVLSYVESWTPLDSTHHWSLNLNKLTHPSLNNWWELIFKAPLILIKHQQILYSAIQQFDNKVTQILDRICWENLNKNAYKKEFSRRFRYGLIWITHAPTKPDQRYN